MAFRGSADCLDPIQGNPFDLEVLYKILPVLNSGFDKNGMGFNDEGLDLEIDGSDQSESAEVTDHHPGQVIAGDVLDDLSSGLDTFSLGIDVLDADQRITQSPHVHPVGAADIGGNHSSQG